MIKFPNNFFWGAATSAHQVEGDNTNNDWWEAEQKGRLPHKSGKACDSYNRYEEDFDLAKAMGNNAHRFSIEWSRIEPEEGKFSKEAIEHYRKVLRALRVRGLEPFVGLHHVTNPKWIAEMGGWTNKKTPEYFVRYVEHVVDQLKDEAAYWITINEPTIVIGHGYIRGSWPPFGNKKFFEAISSLRNIAQAHKNAYAVIRRYNSDAQVGMAHALNFLQPAHLGLVGFAELFIIKIYGYLRDYWFLNLVKKEQDFIGVNYYSRYKFSFTRGFFHDEKEEHSDFGWEIYPKGLYYVVKDVYAKYKKPMYITENGISDADDDQRAGFIKDHLAWLHKAIEEGVDMRGYFYWSLLENFEWAEGFTQRFGLVEIDFETFERKVRKSGEVYGEICKNNGLED